MNDTTIKTNLQIGISNNQILRMALPISLAILVPQLNFITNNIFLGHFNEESLATAGITGVYYLIFAVVGNGINNGMQALIARRAGEDRIGEIGKLFSQGIRIALILAGLGILVTYLIAPWVMRWALHSDSLREQAVSFLKIRIWGLPFLYVYQLRNALLVGTNQSKFLIYGTVAEAGTNVLFDFGLIFGHFGLPALGFNGAAYSSVLSEAAGMLVVFLVIARKGISQQLQLYRHFGYDAANSRLILVQSAPLIFQYVISLISWEYFYILIEHHGQRDLAISNTMRNLVGIFGCFTWAFASTTNAMVSNIIGQGKKDKVMQLVWKITKLSSGFAIAVAIVLNIFPQSFLSIYGQGAEFVQEAVPVMRVVSLAMVMMAVGTVWLNSVTGTGNTRVNLGIEVITLVFYCIYVYLVLAYYNLGITYGWMSEWLYWISTFTLSFIYMRSGRWRNKVI